MVGVERIGVELAGHVVGVTLNKNATRKRFGVLYQPSGALSFHFSYGTAFSTSGDTCQYDDQTKNAPPEGSENLEQMSAHRARSTGSAKGCTGRTDSVEEDIDKQGSRFAKVDKL